MNSYGGGVNKTFYENSCSKLQPNNGVPVQNKWAAAIQITLCVSFKVQRLQYSLTNICYASRVNNQPLGKHSTNGSLPPNHNKKIYDPRVDVQLKELSKSIKRESASEDLYVDWSMNIEFHVSVWNTQLYVGKAHWEWVKRIASHAHFCGYCEESKDQTVNYSNWAFNQWNNPYEYRSVCSGYRVYIVETVCFIERYDKAWKPKT